MSTRQWLKRASPQVIELLERFAASYPFGRVGCLGPLALRDLEKLIGSARAARLIDIQCFLVDYGNAARHRSTRNAVLRLLHTDGVKLPKGKKPRPEMEAMVEDITSLMLTSGMPESTGEFSRMVRALRLIRDELGMEGDPRDELRRQIRQNKAIERAATELVNRALGRIVDDA